MSDRLTLEHSARISGWHATKHKPKFHQKFMNRSAVAYFVVFNLAIWALLLTPVIVK